MRETAVVTQIKPKQVEHLKPLKTWIQDTEFNLTGDAS